MFSPGKIKRLLVQGGAMESPALCSGNSYKALCKVIEPKPSAWTLS